jgi:hypothetical protein
MSAERRVKSKIPGLDGLPVREYRKRFAALKRAANQAKFLTGDGKPRQRGLKHRYPDLDHLPPRQRAVARWNRYTHRERYAKGLTQRGTVPVTVRHAEFSRLDGRSYDRAWKKWNRTIGRANKAARIEREWQAFRAEMGDVTIPEVNPTYWQRNEA